MSYSRSDVGRVLGVMFLFFLFGLTALPDIRLPLGKCEMIAWWDDNARCKGLGEFWAVGATEGSATLPLPIQSGSRS